MAEKQKNYTARLIKGSSYRNGPGMVYYPDKPVVVGEKLAQQLKASGHFRVEELKAAPAPKAEGKAKPKAESKGKGKGKK